MHPPQQPAIANRLLASLSSEDFASLRPHLEPVSLDTRKVLIEPNTPIAHVYSRGYERPGGVETSPNSRLPGVFQRRAVQGGKVKN